MFSKTTKITKQLLVLALLVGVLVMPVTPLVAEEIADVIPTPVTVPVVEETTEAVETPVVPDQEVCTTSTSTSVSIDEVASSSPMDSSSPDVTLTEPEAIVMVPVVASAPLQVETQEEQIAQEENFVTLSEGDPITPGETSSSEENGFETLAGIPTATEQAVSEENSFVTLDEITDTSALSSEGSFNTLSLPADTQAVSREDSFVTLTPVPVGPVVSAENNFRTLPGGPIDIDPAVSPENHFTTLSLPGDPLAVSEEKSFTTLDIPGGPDGGENSFTTLSNGGCTSNCGGGGGGGGGSSSGTVLAEKVYRCPIYLYKFIKFGEANDRREVIKLQAFLKVYEGFKNLKITGTYDRETFEAVKIFQKRYLRDVLKPWQIGYSTGWVYITTRQAINNIYCGRDTKNDLLFRKLVAEEYYRATGEDIEAPIAEPVVDGGYYIVPTSTATTTSVLKPNVFLAGVGELLDFIGENFCWLLNLLLLLLIFFLLWLLWQDNRDDDGEPDSEISEAGIFDVLPPEDEDELAKLAEEDESKLDILDNNPWQEAITLGPETLDEK